MANEIPDIPLAMWKVYRRLIRSRRTFGSCWARFRMKPAREVIEVNLEEWEALLERARQEPLDEEGPFRQFCPLAQNPCANRLYQKPRRVEEEEEASSARERTGLAFRK